MKYEQYFTITEVAEMLKFKRITVRKWITRGKLKAKMAGNHYRITKTDLDEFLEHKQEPKKN